MTPAQKVIAKAREVLRPPERLSPVAWAEKHLILTRGTTSRPGRFRAWPHQRQIINSVCEKNISSVVVVLPRQLLGKSTCLNAIIGWSIHQSPAPMLLVLPSIEAAAIYSKDKIGPLIQDTPVLRKLVHEDELRYRRKGSGDATVSHKHFPGGMILLVSGNTAVRGHVIKRIFFDELSSFPASALGEAGDPVSHAQKTTESFGAESFELFCSTPGRVGECRISLEYENSDRRRWFCTCESCKAEFVMNWKDVQWEKTTTAKGKKIHHPITAHIVCPHCNAHHDDKARCRMALSGRWRPTNPDMTSRAGFQANALISTLGPKKGFKTRLQQWVSEFLEAHRRGTYFSRAFLTNVLAEPWAIETDPAPKYEHLYERREKYREVDGDIVIPSRALFCVTGCDAQPDRLEAVTIAVGMDGEVWSMEFAVFRGNIEGPTPWREFDAFCQKRFRHESGWWLQSVCVACDSKFKSEAVYRYVRSCVGRRVFAIRGERGFAPLGSAWTTRSTSDNDRLYLIRVDGVKESIYSRLRLTEYGPGYQHFPSNDKCGFDMEFFRQLTCETLKTSPSGAQYYEKPSGSSRNEAIDTYTYALAAAEILKPNYAAIARNLERPPQNDWREKQEEKKELLAREIPDLRDVKPVVTNDVNMDNLRNIFSRKPKWLNIGK